MCRRAEEGRLQVAAEAHASHERAEEDRHRDGRRADDELQQLKPDDFIYERRRAAADKEQEQCGKEPTRRHLQRPFPLVSGCSSFFMQEKRDVTTRNTRSPGGTLTRGGASRCLGRRLARMVPTLKGPSASNTGRRDHGLVESQQVGAG